MTPMRVTLPRVTALGVAVCLACAKAPPPDPDGVSAGAVELPLATKHDDSLGCAQGDCADWYRVEAPANGELEAKLDLSAAVPLEIAETAADTASLAALAAELGEGTYRADAAVAAVLAAAGARAAAHLVAVNLTVKDGDVRLARARASEEVAAAAAVRALDSSR